MAYLRNPLNGQPHQLKPFALRLWAAGGGQSAPLLFLFNSFNTPSRSSRNHHQHQQPKQSKAKAKANSKGHSPKTLHNQTSFFTDQQTYHLHNNFRSSNKQVSVLHQTNKPQTSKCLLQPATPLNQSSQSPSPNTVPSSTSPTPTPLSNPSSAPKPP